MNYTEIKTNKWDTNHSRVGDPHNYVTDISINELCSYHKITTPTSKKVLYIGVGYGNCVKELKQLGNTVYGVDISHVALDNVKPFCTTYHTKDLNLIEPVDLALAHLVFQHNSEEEIFRIINSVNLTDDGVFSFQIATLNVDKSILSKIIMEDLNKSMLFFYSKDKIKEIISQTNKEIINDDIEPIWFDEPFNFEWNIIKVKNKK
jgi:hypothetical protein